MAHFLQSNDTMYFISFHENHKFCTNIGGPILTIGECLRQISKLTEAVDVTPVDGFVGCRWDRNGTECHLMVVNEMGLPIMESPTEKEE